MAISTDRVDPTRNVDTAGNQGRQFRSAGREILMKENQMHQKQSEEFGKTRDQLAGKDAASFAKGFEGQG